eukprot:PhF_6_TR22418/c0_g1_i2/m.31821
MTTINGFDYDAFVNEDPMRLLHEWEAQEQAKSPVVTKAASSKSYKSIRLQKMLSTRQQSAEASLMQEKSSSEVGGCQEVLDSGSDSDESEFTLSEREIEFRSNLADMGKWNPNPDPNKSKSKRP